MPITVWPVLFQIVTSNYQCFTIYTGLLPNWIFIQASPLRYLLLCGDCGGTSYTLSIVEWSVQRDACFAITLRSVNQLFLSCTYSRCIWDTFSMRINHVLWKVLNLTIIEQLDIRIEQLMEETDKFTKHSPWWGLHWMTIVVFVWRIWGEHNKHYKENSSQRPEIVAREYLQDVEVVFIK